MAIMKIKKAEEAKISEKPKSVQRFIEFIENSIYTIPGYPKIFSAMALAMHRC